MPKVSVIIPTYNRAQFVGRAIQSVLNQTYKDFEIIIVDDNSTDNVYDVVYSFNDSRIKYIRHDVNLGAPAARNTGILNSKGEFIALLDDDDEFLPEKLEKQLRLFDICSKDIGVVYCGYETVNSEGEIVETFMPTNKGDLFYELLMSNIIGSPTNLIRKECFENICCDSRLKSCQDWDLWIQLAIKYKFDYVPEVLSRYHLTGSSISKNINSVLIGHKQILFKYESYIRTNRIIYSNHLKNIGIYYIYLYDYENALKYLKIAFETYPFDLTIIGRFLFLKIFKKDIHCYFKL